MGLILLLVVHWILCVHPTVAQERLLSTGWHNAMIRMRFNRYFVARARQVLLQLALVWTGNDIREERWPASGGLDCQGGQKQRIHAFTIGVMPKAVRAA